MPRAVMSGHLAAAYIPMPFLCQLLATYVQVHDQRMGNIMTECQEDVQYCCPGFKKILLLAWQLRYAEADADTVTQTFNRSTAQQRSMSQRSSLLCQNLAWHRRLHI